MIRKNFLIVFLAATTILSLSACKKWVDVTPPLQVDENALFSSEQGFRDVLNGVYLQMGTRSAYGRDMTTGLMSVLGRSYDTTITPAIGNLYYQGARFNFDEPEVRTTFKNIWDTLYFSIGNLNNLLDKMESRKDIFTGNNYNTIRGEALGLRAYIHFDLLRMFAPSPAVASLNATGIPYVTKLSPYAIPSSSIGAVMDACIQDLLTAQPLLNDADMSAGRFNSWGLKGLLARIYLYKGDLSNAKDQALAIINSKKFPLAASNSDLMFSKEQLFSLFSNFNIAASYNKSVFNTNPPLGFSAGNQTALFSTGSGSPADWRRAFVDPLTGVALGNTISPRKYYANNAASVNTLPLIRTTEMYYIAAECATASMDSLTATNLLDSVRVHRNLAKYNLPALKTDSLNVEIRKEYQKEFVAEGQMFFYYKRKNIPFSALPFTKVPVVPNASYVFVKPE